MCCIRFSFVGFLWNKENTKIFCGNRNSNFLSQGALDMGFGLLISKWKQSLNFSRILEQEEGAQKCLKELKGDHFSTQFWAKRQGMHGDTASSLSSCHSNNIRDGAPDPCSVQVTFPTIQHLKPLLCPLTVLPVPLAIPAVPLHGSARSNKWARVSLLICVLLHTHCEAGGSGLDTGVWTLDTSSLVGVK